MYCKSPIKLASGLTKFRTEPRTATGELLIMPPTGSETGGRNFNLNGQLFVWTERDGTGIGFDSSTGFTLPNGAKRSPDAAWVNLERWNNSTLKELGLPV